MAVIKDKTKNKVYGATHYYADFRNTADNRYYLVFNEKGVLVDSILRNGIVDKDAMRELEKKYGKLIKLSAIPALSHLPILDDYLALVQDETGKWDAKWSKTDGVTESINKIADQIMATNPTPVLNTDKPARFVMRNCEDKVLILEGVRWTNGTITTVTNGLHRSHVTWNEFYDQIISPVLWKVDFIWIDDESRSKTTANKILQLAKEAGAVSRIASELVDTMSAGK